jgi:uncharacterized membrane protein (DUF2068 family)
MDETTPGTTLVSGIQDISGFLPIIGTEQCEKYVGEALERGFLAAAATPLSMFGTIGIVKATAAIFITSVSSRWAAIFANAGFKLEGSVAAMLAQVGADGEINLTYVAEQKFRGLLEKHHIETARLQLVFDYHRWNLWLCVWTGLLGCVSFTPYIPIIISDVHVSKPFPPWAAPLARIIGAAVSVTAAQRIIQIRISRMMYDGITTSG